jgi:hypothetical protein
MQLTRSITGVQKGQANMNTCDVFYISSQVALIACSRCQIGALNSDVDQELYPAVPGQATASINKFSLHT